MSRFETFTQLHHNSQPFVLGNCWDVQSARTFEASGYKAIGISSQALSVARGYEDGEQLPFPQLLQLASQITGAVHIPFSVDLEAGYSRNIRDIITHMEQLHEAGVAGINLEDTIPGNPRQFQPAADFSRQLHAITSHLTRNNISLFINVRTDAFLLGMPDALNQTLLRIKDYESAGASGLFVPCIVNSSDIQAVTAATALPVNVMCMPDLPGFDTLAALGVKRISMGPFFFNKVFEEAAKLARYVQQAKSFSPLFS